MLVTKTSSSWVHLAGVAPGDLVGDKTNICLVQSAESLGSVQGLIITNYEVSPQAR